MRDTAFRRLFSECLLTVFCALTVALLVSCGGQAVPTRATLDEYTWGELAMIADEISSADGDAQALDVAKRYALVDDDGMLHADGVKSIELADGTKTSAVIAGFRHDDATSGGKTGITFIFADAVAYRAMNSNAGHDEHSASDDMDAIGGWAASDMRAWLNGEFADSLPADLRSVLVKVTKSSGAVTQMSAGVEFTPESLVGATSDLLWLPAAVEVAALDEDSIAAEERPEWSAVLELEGSCYPLFADNGKSEESAAARVRALTSAARTGEPCGWWLRSVEMNTFANIREDGSLNRSDELLAADSQGVVPCFAL